MLRESKGPKSSGSILFLVPIARIEESIRKVGEPDTVIKATGTAAVFPSVTSLARLGGKIVIGGVPEDVVEFSSLSIFRKELTVLLAKGYGVRLAISQFINSRLVTWCLHQVEGISNKLFVGEG